MLMFRSRHATHSRFEKLSQKTLTSEAQLWNAFEVEPEKNNENNTSTYISMLHGMIRASEQ